MSRTPAAFSLPIVRGATWEDEFVYTDDHGQPLDMTGFEARMQVWPANQMYGRGIPALMTLRTDGLVPLLHWDTADIGRVRVYARPDQHDMLNPDNAKKVKYAYWLEFVQPDRSGLGEYVLPIVTGKITVRGSGYRA